MCLSRCSSLVNDCPQYVQKTIVELTMLDRMLMRLTIEFYMRRMGDQEPRDAKGVYRYHSLRHHPWHSLTYHASR